MSSGQRQQPMLCSRKEHSVFKVGVYSITHKRNAGEVKVWGLVQATEFGFYSKYSRKPQAFKWSLVAVTYKIDVFKDYTGLCMEMDGWKIIAEARKLWGGCCNNLGEGWWLLGPGGGRRDGEGWIKLGLFGSRGQLVYLRQIHGSDELCGRRSGHLVKSQCDLSFPWR